MRIRRRLLPLLVILPSLASGLSPAAGEHDGTALHVARAVTDDDDSALSSSHLTKPDVGTKDAPVDGKDGKPHDGPWVDSGHSADDTDTKFLSEKTIKESSEILKNLPEAHDGVMNDRNRAAPKKGTTGTEGGISEKSRSRQGSDTEKSPESPKDDSTVLDSITGDKISSSDKPAGAAGLEKPDDLPDTPYDSTDGSNSDGENEPDPDEFAYKGQPHLEWKEGPPAADAGLIETFHSYILALVMILFAEVGDKTFLLACLMAMRHPQLLVFSAAFSALVVMTILSALLGHAVPSLLSERVTAFCAAGLFFYFGAKLLREGFEMDPDEGVGEEMKEVEMELEEKESQALKAGRRASTSLHALESGRGRPYRSDPKLTPPRSVSPSLSRSASPRGGISFGGALSGLENLLSLLLSPAWVQTFIMTFLAELGDRSQVATIAMAAGDDYWWVVWGAISGHAVCTGAAVLGGRAIAGKVSMRVVTLGGGGAFLVFGFIYGIESLYFM